MRIGGGSAGKRFKRRGSGNIDRVLSGLRAGRFVLTALLVLTLGVPHTANAAKRADAAARKFVQVEGGGFHSVGLRADGTVWTWGRNLIGELGLQEHVSFSPVYAPVRLGGLSGIKDISASATAYGYNLAVKADGTVWEWGAGLNRRENGGEPVAGMPRRIDGLDKAVSAAASLYYGVAVHKDGTVWSWERGPEEERRSPAPVPGLKDVVEVVAETLRAYAIRKDGSVWMWSEPIPWLDRAAVAPAKIPGLANIRQVAGIELTGTMLALDGSGRVWTLDESGKAVRFHPELEVQEIRSGGSYSLLLTTGGDVYSYGYTVTGKQGKVAGIADATAIGAGEHHSLAIDANGYVWGWGSDKKNQIGRPALRADKMVYIPLRAAPAIDMAVNGKTLDSPFPALAMNGTAFVPAKVVAAALGADFRRHYDKERLMYVYELQYGDRTVQFELGTAARRNGELFKMTTRPRLYPGAVMIPLQLLEEGLGLQATWDSRSGSVAIASV